MTFLAIRNLEKYFGGLRAVSDFSVEVPQGDLLALIGPNGAGKSTLLNMIGGTLRPSKGTIFFKKRDITHFSACQRAKIGISRVFQRNALFKSMTALENVLAGAHLQNPHGLAEIFWRKQAHVEKDMQYRRRALELLEFVGLKDQAEEPALNLSHGHQRMLCIAVALAAQPELLLLDEPLTGMTGEETAAMVDIVRFLRNEKSITIIVVEHNMKAVLGMCEHTVVLNFGKKMMEAATPKECVEHPAVIEAYLGADNDVP